MYVTSYVQPDNHTLVRRPMLKETCDAAQDVEAQRSIDNDLTVDEADARERLNNTHRPPPDYAHSGRGGAGNWFSPREEIEKQGQQEGQEMKPMEKDRPGKTSSPSTPSSSTSSTTSPTMGRREIKFRPGGRGGAGNIEYGRQIQEQRRREAERAANKNQGKKDVEISQQVVVDVEAGLTPPPKARLGKDRLRSEL